MQRTALIIGATGLVGNSLLTQLGSLYQKVIIIARSQPKGLSDSMHFYQLKDFNQIHEFEQEYNKEYNLSFPPLSITTEEDVITRECINNYQESFVETNVSK